MTNTMNQNPESCTGSDTPETDVEASNGSLCDQCVPADFARKLERERDKYWNQSDSFLDELGKTQERMFNAERERNILASALRDIMNSSNSTSMYSIAKETLEKWKH